MSRLARAVEILEVLNDFFQEHDGQVVLYSDAQLLDGDITIKDAIADCIGMQEEMRKPLTPRSKRRTWGFHPATGYSGWVGRNKVKSFATREQAVEWVGQQ